MKFFYAAIMGMVISCGNPSTANKADTPPMKTDTTHKFTADMVTEKTDPVCGMPVTAGITDTAQYKGKVFGFCSAECKELFVKSPGSYLK